MKTKILKKIQTADVHRKTFAVCCQPAELKYLTTIGAVIAKGEYEDTEADIESGNSRQYWINFSVKKNSELYKLLFDENGRVEI